MPECPICHATNIRYYPYNTRKLNVRSVLSKVLPYVNWAVPASIAKLKTLSNPKNRLFSGKVAVCNDCGYGVMEKIPSSEQLTEYYNYNYWTKSKEQSEPLSTNYDFQDKIKDSQIDFMSTSIPLIDIRSMLEIGAGAARSSIILKESYKNIIQSDICESGLSWEEYYQSYGLNLVSDFFPRGINKEYDLIYASHWLEHVGDLNEVVKSLFNATQTDGYVYIEVPNCDNQYWLSSFPDLPHIHFFTQQSLSVAFEKQGFETAKIGCAGPSIENYLTAKQPVEMMTDNPEGMWLRAVFKKH